jgi:outer membrane protein assembly factor BamB
MRQREVWTLLGIITFAATATAEDWPQWMGPRRDSVWRETGVISSIPASGLPVKWRVPVSHGYAGPAVVDGKVFVTDLVVETGEIANNPGSQPKVAGRERVLCLDATSGETRWKFEYPETYEISYPGGPRVTPTVDGDRVYTLGAEGKLHCLKTADGEVVWSKDLKAEYKTKSPFWGHSAAPLIDGDKLFCLAGGEGSVAVALDKHTGREIWRALSAPDAGYCPPVLITAGGTQQLIIWHPAAINGLNPKTGEVYWSIDLKPDFNMSVTAPRQLGDYLYASGIGNVGALLRLDQSRPAAEVVWRGEGSSAVYCSNSTPFLEDGTIYGNGCQQGELRGVDLKSGRRLWESYQPTTGNRPAGHATVFLVKHEDRFFLFNEQGDLILARLTREGYKELGRFHFLEPTNEAFGRPVVWSHPAFANRCVYARNDKEVVCVSLAAE